MGREGEKESSIVLFIHPKGPSISTFSLHQGIAKYPWKGPYTNRGDSVVFLFSQKEAERGLLPLLLDFHQDNFRFLSCLGMCVSSKINRRSVLTMIKLKVYLNYT